MAQDQDTSVLDSLLQVTLDSAKGYDEAASPPTTTTSAP